VSRARIAARMGVLAWVLSSLVAPTALAHPLRFAVLHLTEHDDGTVAVSFRFSGSEARPGGVTPVLPAECRLQGEPVITPVDYGEARRFTMACGPGGLAGATIRLEGLDADPDLQALVRIDHHDGRSTSSLLSSGAPEVHVAGPSSGSALRPYLALGVEHILEGVDHLLFVLGLMLLVGLRWRLVGTITAFTVGHSITLALAVLGLVRVPSAPVEAAIALSILLVAVELARSGLDPARKPTLTQRYPALVAGVFGLLHGLGFAGALMEVGLPQAQLPMALLGFNLGVELGQLLFVAIVAVGMTAARRLRMRPMRWPRTVAVYAMGSVAVYYVLDRLVA
jgi:hydrogenase/urease accessory protein HupE